MRRFNLASPAAVDEFKPCHCAGSFVCVLNHPGKCGVTERSFEHMHSIGTAEFDRVFRQRHCRVTRCNRFRIGKPDLKDQAILLRRQKTQCPTELALVCRTIRFAQRRLVIGCALPKRNWIREIKIVTDVCVEVVGVRAIGFDYIHTRGPEITLPSGPSRQISALSPRLVINDPVANRLSCLVQIRSRKVVANFRQIVVNGAYFCCEHRVCHCAPG